MQPYIARAIATAARLINGKGGLCMWVSPSVSVADAAQPWRLSAGPETSYSAKLLFFQRGGEIASLLTVLRGTDVVMGKRYAFMAAQIFTPKMTDFILLPNGEKETITAIDPFRPDGVETVFYVLELRG